MRQGITIDKKIKRQGIVWKDAFYTSLETMDFGKFFMRQGILLGHFLCDRVHVQGVKRFAAHPHHFPGQVPPPPPGQKTKCEPGLRESLSTFLRMNALVISM